MTTPTATPAAIASTPHLSTPASTHAPEDGNAAARQFAQHVAEEEIWQISENFWMRSHFPYPTGSPLVWVKFGGAEKQAEADMQRLAWQWVQDERQAKRCSPGIHIPEVFRTFTRGDQTFIIMELIHGTVLAKSVYARQMGSLYSVPHCYDLIAEAIQLLCGMPVPPDATPGPYTPDHRFRIIKHPLFKEQEATAVYQNIDQLEDHINRVIPLRFRNGNAPRVDLERELVFTYSDFNDENFLFNTDSEGRLRLYLIDFEHASFLPPSFLAFAILRDNH